MRQFQKHLKDQKDLYKVVINKDVIAKKSDPILIYSNKFVK